MIGSGTASSPQCHATVIASAGTGKTWLLVTRLIRLLLAGVRPGAILAVTFTRKAAAEMHARLNQRLFEFVECNDTRLALALEIIGVAPTLEHQDRARRLYETLLRSEDPIKITTFHAFCQDLLRRFPLEAEVPAGFELLDKTGVIESAACDALFSEATLAPGGELAKALDTLFDSCGASTLAALQEFLRQRSDWWAYSEGRTEPVTFAGEALAKQLDITQNADPIELFFCQETTTYLAEFVQLLNKHATSLNLQHAELLRRCLVDGKKTVQHLLWTKAVFLREDGEPRKRTTTKVQLKAMGEDGQSRFLSLHEILCNSIKTCLEQQARLKTLTTCRAWFFAGRRLLDHYQRIKAEQRLLDFTDLEWKAYQLLNRSDNAQWVQYKLDQRIDHLLIDEFQDTNPTQWSLILPLLQELAAGEAERARSVFLVGDSKQSIYRFRRADPRLLSAAQTWMSDNLQAETCHLEVSWRSASAIIDFLNQVFAEGPLCERLQTFQHHATHHDSLWGRVELLPLITSPVAAEEIAAKKLRNPLEQPRLLDEDQRHYREGRLIAERIERLFDQHTLMGADETARPLVYSDILILLPNRLHAQAYEKALREAGIPYLGAGRGSLLESLEVLDMLALLDTLICPYDNLALAQVLRSPLFACSDADLMRLATTQKAEAQPLWMNRLATLAPDLEDGTPLRRAHDRLTEWRAMVGRIPVHDLLDRIYCEGNVLARYESAFPAHLRLRVRSNLTHFIELALDIDSGRYPSLAHFRARVRELREHPQDSPDEASAQDAQAGVRILTIHAAKGLEAPVVFLADAAPTARTARPYRALIDWPSGAQRPSAFLLTGKKAEQDGLCRRLLEQQEEAERREDTNLLYVALTRAKQLLFISGCAPLRAVDLGWYGMIAQRMGTDAVDTPRVLESGRMPRHANRDYPQVTRPSLPPDPRLSQPLSVHARTVEIASDRAIDRNTLRGSVGDGKRRDAILHMLKRLTICPQLSDTELLRQVASELSMGRRDSNLLAWWAEARRVAAHPSLRELFDSACYVAAYNAVPMSYRSNGQVITGVIDRLVINEDKATLISYEIYPMASPDTLAKLAEPYREPMRLYLQGVRKLWPEKTARAVLLFTACAMLYEMPDGSGGHATE